MTDYRTDLKHDLDRVGPASFTIEDVSRRHDRKRKIQRITAAVVGMAVFVVAVWAVTSVRSLDRSQTSNVPAASGTTGPTETVNPGHPFSVDNSFVGLPPEGATLSEPARGELVASNDDYRWHARVYADGRLIWQHDGGDWLERRLTPEGVDRVRSQPKLLQVSRPGLVIPFQSLPASVWEDTDAKQYAAPRYALCTSQEGLLSLPQQASDLIGDVTNPQSVERGEVGFFAGGNGSRCPAVTVEEARQLDVILTTNGYQRTEEYGDSVWYADPSGRLNPFIVLTMLLPDGSLA